MPVIFDLSMVDSNVAAVLATLQEIVTTLTAKGNVVPLRYVNLYHFKNTTLDCVVKAAHVAIILLAIFLACPTPDCARYAY
jgi:hypothetical protein